MCNNLVINMNQFFSVAHFSNVLVDLDLIQSAWTQNIQTDQKMRTLSFTISLTQALGPRTCHVTETQVTAKLDLNNDSMRRTLSRVLSRTFIPCTGDAALQ